MSTVEREQQSRILTFAAQAMEQVRRVALTPATWVEVAAFISSMADALDHGDFAGLDEKRRLLERKLPVRQDARARLDPEKVPASPQLRGAAENLNRKIESARASKGDDGTKR